ncbi:MAG: hypothetical protein SFV55_18850 [Haliscomenobacter sp.]|uniref:hypothetical protein n=1 Tax=Haliscomenobacter sp. TaxID=2717303 RepID=UPI0029B274BA|nr:hypothetical protein [Haliscomenobacter sp.]MDX2070494.1 hypothetical protein [Haliscomenobacter sp.]
MDHLIELVQFLSKNKFKHLEVFAKNSRLLTFYEKLRDGSFKTEAQARDFFFPGDKNAKAYYYRLAQQLEERLINLLFLVDFNQTADNQIQKEVLICQRNYAAFSSLIARFMRKPAIKIAEETIKISLNIELTDVTLPLARYLAIHYGTLDPNKKKYQYYAQLVEQMQPLLNAEILAEKYYTEVQSHYGVNRSSDLVFAKKIAIYTEELRALTQNLSSYRLNMISHYLFVSEHHYMINYEKMVEACLDALNFFEKQTQRDSRSIILSFTQNLVNSLHMLQRHSEAIAKTQEIIPLAPANNINWFNNHEMLVYSHLHAQQYESALQVLLEVKNNQALSKQPHQLQEKWRTNEAMVYYLVCTGKVQKPEGIDFKFRTKKFINEFSKSIHDKSGNNIVLITIMILFLLLDKDYSSIIDKIDALKAYTHRHLRRDETYRTNCFIKMIMQLPKGDFHPIAVQRKAEPYYQKLLAVPLHKAKQDFDLEIIPYETLWAFMLESLEPDRKTKVRDR